MESYCKPIKACPDRRSLRAPLRALLKKAARGDAKAYHALTGLYFDLISEHLYLCNFDRNQALQKTEMLLREGWKQLPYLKRLSDWERFLACGLMGVDVSGAYSDQPRPQALIELDSEAKFALVAFDLENWSYRWLSLALRVAPRELQQILFEARCKLLKVDLNQTHRKTRRCLQLVSADLDGQLKPGQRRQVLEKLCSCPETKSFKSRWLDYRCQLIELRQQIRLSTEDRDTFLTDLGPTLLSGEMAHPSITARVRNLFSFKEIESTQLVARNFRYGR